VIWFCLKGMIRKHPVQAIARIGCCEPGIWLRSAHRVVLTVGRSLPVYQDKRRYTAAPEASQKASPANEPSAAKRTPPAPGLADTSDTGASRPPLPDDPHESRQDHYHTQSQVGSQGLCHERCFRPDTNVRRICQVGSEGSTSPRLCVAGNCQCAVSGDA